MKLLMVANFVVFPWEGGNNRFTYLLDKIDCEKNEIELITSNFIHETKKYRTIPDDIIKKTKYKITLLSEPQYHKNISLKRVYSHFSFAKKVCNYLKKIENKPNIIYCAIPSLDVAKVVVKYAKKNNIKLIIDIQDLWPEAFNMVFDFPIISNIVFNPMKKKADYIYANSDVIIAVSETYLNRALKVNKKAKVGLSVFLGTDLDYFDECARNNKVIFNDNITRIAYIGTLGTSYDIKSIIDSIGLLKENGINNIKFIIMGDGPLKKELVQYSANKKVDCEFTGRLGYEKMVGLLCSCDIGVNPIVGKSVASIINKVGDYAASGLPVINTQNSDEYRKLLLDYSAGINCENGNINDIANNLQKLINDENLRKKLGKGNRVLSEEKFNRKKTYMEILKFIMDSR